jgi:DNA adenine methylase
MASAVKRWQTGLGQLQYVHARFKTVQIECADWRVVIDRFDGPRTLFYVDPPYHPKTRVAGKYLYEFTEADHREMIARLIVAEGMIILSGYAHPTYRALEHAGWRRLEFVVPAFSSDSRSRRVECLWLSPTIEDNKRDREETLSPIQKMSHGAYHVHKVRVSYTTKRVLRAMEKLRAEGEKITITAVGKSTKISREHLGRRYGHLFRM